MEIEKKKKRNHKIEQQNQLKQGIRGEEDTAMKNTES
jgi:hypothetical protein